MRSGEKNMTRPTLIIAAVVTVSVVLGLPMWAHSAPSVETVTGTIMCVAPHHPNQYSTACRAGSSRYVLVTRGVTYDIRHQGFSGLRALVGFEVRATGEVKGHVLEILQLVQLGTGELP
jgi:hypothetical protein